MKLTIECNREQADLIINALEESFRFRMKQPLFLEYPLMEIHGKHKDFEEVRAVSTALALRMLRTMYDSISQPKEANEMADMWSVLRHELYLANGGDPNNYMDVRSDVPIQLSDLPLIKVEVEP